MGLITTIASMLGSDDSKPRAIPRNRVAHLRKRLNTEPAELVRQHKDVAALASIRKQTGASLREAMAVLHVLKSRR
ncbi:MAG: hypothetical protein RhofKO_20190 [Rhodothermales bacterium]